MNKRQVNKNMIILNPKKSFIDLYQIKESKISLNKTKTPKFTANFEIEEVNYKLIITNFLIQKEYLQKEKLKEALQKQNLILTKKDKRLIQYFKQEDINYKIHELCHHCETWHK